MSPKKYLQAMEQKLFALRGQRNDGQEVSRIRLRDGHLVDEFTTQRATEDILEINEAIGRISDGTFGLCKTCLEKGKSAIKSRIPRTRLKAIPFATECVGCASNQNDNGRFKEEGPDRWQAASDFEATHRSYEM